VSRILELEREECLALLAGTNFGRLAVNIGGAVPAIRPVNYVFDERSQSIVFPTAKGSKLHGVLTAAKAAFEIDGVDPPGRTGWSVIVVGVIEVIESQVERRRLEGLGLDPWAPGPKPHWVRLRAGTVTGRRITLGDSVINRNIATG
jgi:nitroimidazol reductase NimA-like FMN-containing flavoprotein (pyridoxamine 5'-phosphate oxidase superfamily)